MRLIACAALLTVVAGACSSDSSKGSSETLTAALKAVPSGSVQLSLASGAPPGVHLNAFGLAPSSNVVVQVREGTCLAPTDRSLITFPSAKVPATGKLDATLQGTGQAPGSTPAYVAVFPSNAKGDVSGAFVACTDLDVKTPTKIVSLFPAPGQRGHGSTTLRYDGGADKLVADVNAVGLEPSKTFTAQIHKGSCAAQGSVVHRLEPLEGNLEKNVTQRTVVEDVGTAPPRTGWSVVVSTPSSSGNPSRPLLCGDVAKPAPAPSSTTSTSKP